MCNPEGILEHFQKLLESEMIEKLNETYSLVTGLKDPERLVEFLKVQKPDAYFNKMIKLGFESPFKFFTAKFRNGLMVYNGHRFLLKSFGIEPLDESSGVSDQEITDYLKSVQLPFEPYDYQIQTVRKCLSQNKVLIRSCTSCLDPNTEIDVDIPGYTEQEIKEMLDE